MINDPHKTEESRVKEAQEIENSWASSFSFVGNKQHATSYKFGQSVKNKRKQSGMTQTELARRSGLNRSYLSDLERGASSISLDRAAKIATALDCHICDLLKD